MILRTILYQGLLRHSGFCTNISRNIYFKTICYMFKTRRLVCFFPYWPFTPSIPIFKFTRQSLIIIFFSFERKIIKWRIWGRMESVQSVRWKYLDFWKRKCVPRGIAYADCCWALNGEKYCETWNLGCGDFTSFTQQDQTSKCDWDLVLNM